jgi:hypothetical protein
VPERKSDTAGALARLTRWAFIAAVVMLAAPAVPSSADPSQPPAADAGSIGLSLIDDGVSAGNDPRARVYIVDHLALGGFIHRRVEVVNTTAATAHVALYAAAASIEHGTFVGAAGRTANDVSTWTVVQPAAIDVPAGGSAFANVTIRVARDAAPTEHYGVVWAEVRSAPGGTGGVVEVSRVGIRIYLSVGPGGAPAAGFTVGSLRATQSSEGTQTVTASVRNTGGRALDMVGTLQLSAGPGRVRAGPFPVTLGTTVAVGRSAPITIALCDRLPAGSWTADLILRSGLLERTTRATITFPDKAKSLASHDGSSDNRWLPAGIVAAAALLGVAVVLVALRRRRLRQ